MMDLGWLDLGWLDLEGGFGQTGPPNLDGQVEETLYFLSLYLEYSSATLYVYRDGLELLLRMVVHLYIELSV